ncbi:MAG: hypothetical protein BWY82_02765 [Verrucomicrobia bacterium ADurb.Bin474]|nr:MAG: hypothetical protein BWY82_02765 [Verrucomicrobia bacterium ADurb.Bin474]
MRQIHANRSPLDQHRVSRISALKQLTLELQRIVQWMTIAEHPLIAHHPAHAAANLIREILQSKLRIGKGQSTAQGVVQT